MDQFNLSLEQALKYGVGAGAHGTPAFDPEPHPLAGDPAEVRKRRESDPLWQYHRGLRGSLYFETPQNGWSPSMYGEKPSDRSVFTHSQAAYHDPDKKGPPLPEGFIKHEDARLRAVAQTYEDADQLLTRQRFLSANDNEIGHLERLHPQNEARYNALFGFHAGGRRPWFNAVSPIQDMEGLGAPHDPYKLLAASVLSGNQHALPFLVDELKKRDNPAGWSGIWTKLAKAMADRVGDQTPHQTYRRVAAIAQHTAHHSADPDGHRRLAESIQEQNADRGVLPGHSGEGVPEPDLSGYAALADHLEENGLPQYGQLMRAELANQMPTFRWKPKNKRSRL